MEQRYLKDDFRPYIMFENVEISIEDYLDSICLHGRAAAEEAFDQKYGVGFFSRFSEARIANRCF